MPLAPSAATVSRLGPLPKAQATGGRHGEGRIAQSPEWERWRPFSPRDGHIRDQHRSPGVRGIAKLDALLHLIPGGILTVASSVAGTVVSAELRTRKPTVPVSTRMSGIIWQSAVPGKQTVTEVKSPL